MPNEENLKPFGQDNPPPGTGRPKGSRNRSTIAKRWLAEEQKAKNPITEEDEDLSQEDIITLAMLKKARGGDVRAYRALMDSAYGAPKQPVEHSGVNGSPIQVEDVSKLSNEELKIRLAEIRRKKND